MLIFSFTCSPKRVSVKLLPQGDTVVMVDYLKDTRKRFGSLRSGKTSFRDLFLMWDNAKPHTSRWTKKFLKTSKDGLVNQSPYSPDRKLKSVIQNPLFHGPEDILLAVQRGMKEITKEELSDQLIKLRDHLNFVIQAGGDYISEI